ncbi:Short-chain dehydrogenase/reductase SAT3 [Lachnellula suecica]|uniref:Short-chain dehydrogenase/reductase SAT3 n=1 Tax=Lachnellula suecica TaxID=602035 RepID=A0A8T9BTQ0_9HELO|nr:Short-chain dehydrogenase/reductase SAT3 [Lachnellula suecica]
MSVDHSSKAIPAQLGFLAIYNPSLGTTDDTVGNQIVYYSSPQSQERSGRRRAPSSQTDDAAREENNLQLRQIGLAQGMVEFGNSFSDGRAVDSIETEKSRIVLHELEAGWWILASINLTVLPGKAKEPTTKGKALEQQQATEYSSREVKPAILLLGDLLRAHSTFLLHHASSMSALFVRTKRSKFMGILGRYWDTYLATWNVLMHGNPASSLYGGIKIAACGELGVGVGEEERGSGEREVLEGFVDRIDGLVDVIVSRYGDADSEEDTQGGTSKKDAAQGPTKPWLGSGNDPAAEDGAIFLGTGALSRKSLRDVSHWMEDLYRWGPYAYGVLDNPTSTRRAKKPKSRSKKQELSPIARKNARQIYGLGPLESPSADDDSMATLPPMPINDGESRSKSKSKLVRRPSLMRGSSHNSTDSDSNKTSAFVRYLKLGYGTHWSLGGTAEKAESQSDSAAAPSNQAAASKHEGRPSQPSPIAEGVASVTLGPSKGDSAGHYLIGLMGDIEDESDNEELADENAPKTSTRRRSDAEDDNPRLVLRTLTLESEREEDARGKAEISIDLGSSTNEQGISKHTSSEHTAKSTTSFESQDRNKTKKLRVVVYANKPFIFIFLFELRADSLALKSLYRSLHHQLAPLIKPLTNSTTFRASKPDMTATTSDSNVDAPIYDLVWDPRLLTINSTIPNIPDPYQSHSYTLEESTWSRMDALNTHMQIINTYTATTRDGVEMERTCKTSRGWWVVWTRVPEPRPEPALASGPVKVPGLIAEDGLDESTNNTSGIPNRLLEPKGKSRGSSTFGGSSLVSGPAHPFLDTPNKSHEWVSKDKEIFLVRRASDYIPAKSSARCGKRRPMDGQQTVRTTRRCQSTFVIKKFRTSNRDPKTVLPKMVSTEELRAEHMFSMKGHVCVVTGGGTGIGLMATQALAANGARVYITGRRMEALENAAKTHSPKSGGSIIPAGPCDVTDKESLENLVAEISKKEKHIDLLITAAGISGPKAEPESGDASKLKETLFNSESFSEWSSTYNTNVSAVYFTTVAFLPLLQASKSAHDDHFSPSVIVISSMSGIMRHAQGHFSYNAAKAATVHLSKMMSFEFKEAGIRVNSIAPGYFPSEMTTKESDENQKSELPKEKIDEKGHVPAGRAGSDEEMGMGVLFLARNKYVNGEIIAIDGGVLLEMPGR